MSEVFKRVLVLLSVFLIFALIKPFIIAINRVNNINQDSYIVNIGYIGSYLSGTLGILLTAGSLIFLAKTLSFERKKSDQENFDNRFFLMLERLEVIKDKVDENIKKKILNEIDNVSEFSVEKTLEESKKIIHKYNSEIGHYYRMLYQILKMINQNKDNIANFQNVSITYYTNILRSTLDFKLTQILAINIYHSEGFDDDYKDYAIYVSKYSFLQHMPFCIKKDKISEALLAVYINFNKYEIEGNAFKGSSFVIKLNSYVLGSVKKSIDLGYNYDLKYILLKRLAGKWDSFDNENLKIDISLISKKMKIQILKHNIYIELRDHHSDNFKDIKCKLYNDHPYRINSYFDEKLNLIIVASDNEDDFKQSGRDVSDVKTIKLKLCSTGLNNLTVTGSIWYMYDSLEQDILHKIMKKIDY